MSTVEWEEGLQELLRRISEGSQDAAWELVERYGEAIRRAVRRFLAVRLRSQFDSLDFVQLVWKSFFDRDHSRGRFKTARELLAYLVTMARYKVGMEVRRRLMTEKRNLNRERYLDDSHADFSTEVRDRGPAPLDVVIARERWEKFTQDRPAQCRQIIEMKLRGHTIREIADSLHIAGCTVSRFLKKLLHETPV